MPFKIQDSLIDMTSIKKPCQGPGAPTASVTYGAAGVAYALIRIAQVPDDPKMLALADRWADRAAVFPMKKGLKENIVLGVATRPT